MIDRNIRDRQAAEALHRTIGELLREEIPRLPSDESRAMFWGLLKASAEKNLPAPVTPPEPEKTKPVKKKSTPYKPTMSSDGQTALDMIDEIEEMADSICDNGREFAESVMERARDIGESVEAAGNATEGQLGALENMAGGLRAWFHD